MAARESSLWRAFKTSLPVQAHGVRIENSVDAGTPDVNVCLPGWSGWVELKVQEVPVRKTTKFKCPHFTHDQRMWLNDRTRAGGKAYLLIRAEHRNKVIEYVFLRGDVAAVWVGACTLDELREKSAWTGSQLSTLVDYMRGQ